MDFTADHYFRASVERMSQAQHLYRQGEGYYALAMYAAGLAVECLLRGIVLPGAFGPAAGALLTRALAFLGGAFRSIAARQGDGP